MDCEADSPMLLLAERRPRGRDPLRARVERIYGGRVGGSEGRQPPLPTADVHDSLALKMNKRADCLSFSSFFVSPVHRYGAGLYALTVDAAGAELLRLAPGVLELRAGVGVDELPGLDPLEAVML